jgi:hypothetical protein
MRKILAVVCLCTLTWSPIQAQEESGGSAAGKPSPPGRRVSSEGSSPDSAQLPVRRVVLYKNGVGYFEHLGRVRGSQDVHIDFTSGQLNDVLKSLTVLDLSGGRITGVDYNSEAPLARRLSTLRLALGERPTEAEFLSALRGARLEVRTGSSSIAGKLLSVEHKTRLSANGTAAAQVDEISLISDAGEVRSAELTPSTSIRIADRDLTTEVGKYLALIASAREQDVRRMTISTAGTGERNLYVSYISEVPIWKTTYRIVLPTKEGKKPLLQGWAIVDNTVGEDWNDVELSLVAGAPHSFIQQLSLPYYGRRPVVPLPESVALSPQTHASTLEPGVGQLSGQITDASGDEIPNANVRVIDQSGQVVARGVTDDDGNYSFDALPAGNYRLEVQGQGFNKLSVRNLITHSGANTFNGRLNVAGTSETVEVDAGVSYGLASGSGSGMSGGSVGKSVAFAPPPPAPPPPGAISYLNIASEMGRQQQTATAADLGDLFEYKLKEPVTIRKNQSALVPIAQTEIDAEKVSLWSESLGISRPLRALWLDNTSNLTLDGGSFSVLDENTFAGEGILEAIKPGERRLLSYATDLGLTVSTNLESEQQRVTRVSINRGVMLFTSELQERKTYTVRNEDTSERILVIEHPARPGWILSSDSPKPEETASGLYRFRLPVASKKTVKLVVRESRPLTTTYELNNLNDEQISLFVSAKQINPEIESALREIIKQRTVVAVLNAQLGAQQKQIDQIFADQQRLRENMKALKGSAEEKLLLQRYTKQLDDEENQLATLRKNMQGTTEMRDAASAQLSKMIGDLKIDATL